MMSILIIPTKSRGCHYSFTVRLVDDSLCGKDGTIMDTKELMIQEEQYKNFHYFLLLI